MIGIVIVIILIVAGIFFFTLNNNSTSSINKPSNSGVQNAGQVSPEKSEGQTHTVKIQGFNFIPSSLTIQAGDSVVWINEDSAPHTASADNGEFDTDRLAEGESGSYTFTNTGDYSYICSIHPSMKGLIIVQ